MLQCEILLSFNVGTLYIYASRVRFMASTHGGVLVTWRYPRGADCLRGFRVEFAATQLAEIQIKWVSQMCGV